MTPPIPRLENASARSENVLGEIAQQHDRTESANSATPRLSLVSPVYDEEENLPRLYESIVAVFGSGDDWELLLVDDGSKDNSADVIRSLAAKDARVVGVFFARNCGQTAALGTGIQLARGELIATLDADLQVDPADLPGMIELLGDNDAVVGYRQKRNDNWLRRISSRIANRIRNWISRDQIIDTGCSLKLFRASAIRVIPLFEGLHRFFPTLLRYHGFKVLEAPVSHRPREAGVSKYGVMNRAWVGFKDLLAVRWMHGRMIRIPNPDVTQRERS